MEYDGTIKVVSAFSGGKDSTCMGEIMAERGERFVLLFTRTDNELPEVYEHVERMRERWNVPLICPPGPSLQQLIDLYEALPSHRQRWCTRQIKIQPCIAWLTKNPGCTLCVGLRADEEERVGLYGPYATYRYPLREAGLALGDVKQLLRSRGIKVPKRTDCAWCYGQRIVEWFDLWREHPEVYARGEALEKRLGYTFRSPNRDTWPASLEGLRLEFERGRKIRGLKVLPAGSETDDADDEKACRVCRF